MQIFSCPFCGPRPETEFHFGGDAGNTRPAPDCTSAEWARYLHIRHNPKGDTNEVWVHLTCGEFFTMARDSVTMAAAQGVALGAAPTSAPQVAPGSAPASGDTSTTRTPEARA